MKIYRPSLGDAPRALRPMGTAAGRRAKQLSFFLQGVAGGRRPIADTGAGPCILPMPPRDH